MKATLVLMCVLVVVATVAVETASAHASPTLNKPRIQQRYGANFWDNFECLGGVASFLAANAYLF